MHPETNPHFIRLDSQHAHLPGQRSPWRRSPVYAEDQHGRQTSPTRMHHPDERGLTTTPHLPDHHGRPSSPPFPSRGDQHGRQGSSPPEDAQDLHGYPTSPPLLSQRDQYRPTTSRAPHSPRDERGRRGSPPPRSRSKIIDPAVLPFVRIKPRKSKHPKPSRSPTRDPVVTAQHPPPDIPPERQRQMRQARDDDQRRQPQGKAVIPPPSQHPPPYVAPDRRQALSSTRPDRQRPYLTPQYTKPVPLSPGPVSPSSTGRRYGTNGPLMPPQEKTNPLTWSAAVCCAIFWLIIILGGLIVLIVYLLYRPRSPNVAVSDASLNMAYLDMGFLLNADLTFLANFTNPSKKGVVRFTYVTFELYHGHTLLSIQYVPSFSVSKAESVLANVHFVSSQVQMSLGEIQRLQTESRSNKIMFSVRGVFHASTHLGSLLRYSYHLYSQCTIALTSPPNGVLNGSRCTSKR